MTDNRVCEIPLIKPMTNTSGGAKDNGRILQ